MENIQMNLTGQNNYLTKYEKTLIVTKDYIDASQSVGVARYHLGKHICPIIKLLNPHNSSNNIRQDPIIKVTW